jgi:hypothetical protein
MTTRNGNPDTGSAASCNYEVISLEKTRNVCPMCEDYATRQAAKPVAVMCCEGACLRGGPPGRESSVPFAAPRTDGAHLPGRGVHQGCGPARAGQERLAGGCPGRLFPQLRLPDDEGRDPDAGPRDRCRRPALRLRPAALRDRRNAPAGNRTSCAGRRAAGRRPLARTTRAIKSDGRRASELEQPRPEAPDRRTVELGVARHRESSAHGVGSTSRQVRSITGIVCP